MIHNRCVFPDILSVEHDVSVRIEHRRLPIGSDGTTVWSEVGLPVLRGTTTTKHWILDAVWAEATG